MAVNSSYGAATREIRELFNDYLEGVGGEPALAVSSRPLSATARNAIDKSLQSFGYDACACAFLSLSPVDEEAEGHDITLDAQALFVVVEGLDPLFVIATDHEATQALGHAYRTNYGENASIRVFGRQSVAFSNLDQFLQSESGKQKAWKVLKSLKG